MWMRSGWKPGATRAAGAARCTGSGAITSLCTASRRRLRPACALHWRRWSRRGPPEAVLLLVAVLLEVLGVVVPVVVEHFAELVHEVRLGFFFFAVVGFQVALGTRYQEDVVAGGGEQQAGANQLRCAF